MKEQSTIPRQHSSRQFGKTLNMLMLAYENALAGRSTLIISGRGKVRIENVEKSEEKAEVLDFSAFENALTEGQKRKDRSNGL